MSIRLYKSYTPGTRNRALSAFDEITKAKPERNLIQKIVVKDEITEELLQFVIAVEVIKDVIDVLILNVINMESMEL